MYSIKFPLVILYQFYAKYRWTPMARETGIQSQVESYQRLKKWYFIPFGLTLSIIRYGTKVKESNPRKGVALSPTLQCISYWKGSFSVAFDYGHQLYFTVELNILKENVQKETKISLAPTICTFFLRYPAV